MNIEELSERLNDLAGHVAKVAAEHPDWVVVRNDVRNFALYDPEDLSYRGYIDLGDDEVQLRG